MCLNNWTLEASSTCVLCWCGATKADWSWSDTSCFFLQPANSSFIMHGYKAIPQRLLDWWDAVQSREGCENTEPKGGKGGVKKRRYVPSVTGIQRATSLTWKAGALWRCVSLNSTVLEGEGCHAVCTATTKIWLITVQTAGDPPPPTPPTRSDAS